MVQGRDRAFPGVVLTYHLLLTVKKPSLSLSLSTQALFGAWEVFVRLRDNAEPAFIWPSSVVQSVHGVIYNIHYTADVCILTPEVFLTTPSSSLPPPHWHLVHSPQSAHGKHEGERFTA